MYHLTPFVGIWALVSAVTLGLALYRKFISAHEQDIVFLGTGEEGKISEQQLLAARLAVIDKWGKTLTVVVLVAGLMISVVFLYNVWLETGSIT